MGFAAGAGITLAGLKFGGGFEALGYTETANLTALEDRFAAYWPRNIMMLFGPPGGGKGTQGPKIEGLLETPQLSTGDMLRAAVAAQTEVGKKAQGLMKAGKLVGDDVVIGIIKDRITQPDCRFGFILDGFPRNLAQAKALDAMLAENGECVTKVSPSHAQPTHTHRWPGTSLSRASRCPTRCPSFL